MLKAVMLCEKPIRGEISMSYILGLAMMKSHGPSHFSGEIRKCVRKCVREGAARPRLASECQAFVKYGDESITI